MLCPECDLLYATSAGYAPMAEWSPEAGAGSSSFGMSGTNAYALTVHPEEPHARGPAQPLKWQRLRCKHPHTRAWSLNMQAALS
jgi:hypothetical protein